ncbi:PHD finger domain [Cordyceps militaris]|uniref:PHD finger domain n=1 Tax=Cordyceps militaris TaxID=73501 RepID=A0A2H4SLJ8_CORMI|nr:PHD finger domain [Cordyceps militaris]
MLQQPERATSNQVKCEVVVGGSRVRVSAACPPVLLTLAQVSSTPQPDARAAAAIVRNISKIVLLDRNTTASRASSDQALPNISNLTSHFSSSHLHLPVLFLFLFLNSALPEPSLLQSSTATPHLGLPALTTLPPVRPLFHLACYFLGSSERYFGAAMSNLRRDSTLVSLSPRPLSGRHSHLVPWANYSSTFSSFGDPNAQPPTPQQTPTSTSFASPVFETPRPPHGSFTDLGGSTPRFAEEYSVFNATPGNLRGSQVQFPDFVPPTPASSHKRMLSAEGFAHAIATHDNHFSPNPNLPPVDPSRRLASSPSLNNSKTTARQITPVSSPSLNNSRSAKKLRRGTITKDPESHIISPPPTAHKGEQKLAPKLNMQYEQPFHQPDFNEVSQAHDVTALMANPGDMFSYPLSAPAAAPANFWDPQASMGMDLDFNAATHGMFPSPAAGHRHTGSFDWHNDIQLFQDTGLVPPSSNQENVQPQQLGNLAMHQYPQQLGDPFSMINPGDMVDPSLMLSQDSAMPSFAAVEQQTVAAPKVAIGKVATKTTKKTTTKATTKATTKPVNRQTGSNTSQSANKGPDRALASSPLKHSRSGVDQPVGNPRGGAALVRSNTLPTLAPASRSMAQVAGGSTDTGRPMTRPNGRVSPVKHQHRLSSLASIRESSSARQRASVRFTIDARGFARAETTLEGQCNVSQSLPRSQSSRDLPSRSTRDASSDSESEDEDPIIIPSRNNSFCASFALPDPRKPVGSIFHRPRRSTSDRSSSSAGGEGGEQNGDESEAETILNEQRGRGGDAASELVKLVESRNKTPAYLQMLHNSLTYPPSETVSPCSIAESGYGTDGIRCVCKQTTSSKNAFMIQCDSCEMWLHGNCLGITKRTMPNVYICAFCANTPTMGGNRAREELHVNALGIASPAGTKAFRSFR